MESLHEDLASSTLSLTGLFRNIERSYEELLGEREGATSGLDRRDPKVQYLVQSTIDQIKRCKEDVQGASLFSSNEDLDDLTTGSLLLMKLDYILGSVLQQRTFQEGRCVSAGIHLQKAREVSEAWTNFIELVSGYGIVHDFAERASGLDPRSAKIKQYKDQLEMKKKRDELRYRLEHRPVDDDLVRDFYLQQLRLDYANAIEGLESVKMEMTLLQQAKEDPAREPGQDHTSGIRANDWRLDKSQPKALLSKEGRPLHPFVILPQQKTRQEIKDQVFQPGHRLPTMSIDEYLENEARRGNIIGGPDSNTIAQEGDGSDEDDERLADRQTYKDREGDEFKDSNPKGSGNQMSNRG